MKRLSRPLSVGCLVLACQGAAMAASSFVIDAGLPIDATGYGASSTFSLGVGMQSLDLLVTATSDSSLDDLVLYAQTSPSDFTLVDLSRLIARSAFTPAGGGYGLNYSYSGLSAGQYAFDVFGTAGSSARLVGQSAVTVVPEPEGGGLAAVGALVALIAARKRRTA